MNVERRVVEGIHVLTPTRRLVGGQETEDLTKVGDEIMAQPAPRIVVDLKKIDYAKVIALAPDHYDAWHNRSTLRKQTADDNHIRELEQALNSLAPGHAGKHRCAMRSPRSTKTWVSTSLPFPGCSAAPASSVVGWPTTSAPTSR